MTEQIVDPDLALFVRVADAGSLSAAARKLNLSPATVSKRIARLEQRLGIRLLHRTTRRMRLTPKAERFCRDVRGILIAIEEAEARVRDRADVPAGLLRVTAPTSFGRLHIAPHLLPFIRAHPQVELELDLSDGFTDLAEGGYDLAIRITGSLEPGMDTDRLADSRRVLCAAPSYLEAVAAPVSADDLSDHHLLWAHGQMPWRLTGPNGPISVERPSRVQTNSSEVVRELAIAGAGIALRSLWDVGCDLAEGRLIRVLPGYWGTADVGIFAISPHTAPRSVAAKAFVEHLRNAWREGLHLMLSEGDLGRAIDD